MVVPDVSCRNISRPETDSKTVTGHKSEMHVIFGNHQADGPPSLSVSRIMLEIGRGDPERGRRRIS